MRNKIVTEGPPFIQLPGSGRTVQRKYVTVPVPAGVEDGQTVRMPVGKREIFITFRVSVRIIMCLHMWCYISYPFIV